MVELESVVKRLDEIKRFFSQDNSMQLRSIGNNAIREAAIYNDKVLAEISLIAYCLHKLLTKEHILSNPKWNSVKKTILDSIETSIQCIKRNELESFFDELESIIRNIQGIDSELGHFVSGLYDKSRVKNAAEAYSFGMSLSQAADLTGADKKDVLMYIGYTTTHDESKTSMGIGERLRQLKELMSG